MQYVGYQYSIQWRDGVVRVWFSMFSTWLWSHFPCPENCKKGLSFSPVSPNFRRVARPQTPISQPSTPQNSTSAPLFRCPETPFLIPQTAFWDTPNDQMGVFCNTFCCHSYGCFTPLKRVFLPSHSVEIGHKTHVYAPSKTGPPSIKRTLDAANHKERSLKPWKNAAERRRVKDENDAKSLKIFMYPPWRNRKVLITLCCNQQKKHTFFIYECTHYWPPVGPA